MKLSTITLSALLAFANCLSLAQPTSPDTFENSIDIGNPAIAGNTHYDVEKQEYTIVGSGQNIWFADDEFQYSYKKIEGDFILTANFEFLNTGTNPHRKTGWMARASLEKDAMHAAATIHGSGLTALQFRTEKGKDMEEIQTVRQGFSIVRLERQGNNFIMLAAHPGEPLQVVGQETIDAMPVEVYVGLFACAHDSTQKASIRVWNVRINKPVSDDFNGYSAKTLGCRLETMDVFSGERKVVYEDNVRFEAPNWMPDGKNMLFNQGGHLYTIPVNGGKPVMLNTGFADQINNDHGISFDGKMLAISCHREGEAGGGSAVYVLPLAGGTPRLVTEKTPSYWHGWSPDGKDVAFVGQRNGVFDIYKMAVDGGMETPLTHNSGTHADGPEYTPEGQYIYYNANLTGTMQIWRMKPDGSDKEQITFDEYNDWFPHISPDGQWIVFISFPPDIQVADHPFCKRVMLRLMPLSGGAPRVIAYLYGGQGTMNVPSWSPDSRRIAFVSNSGVN